MSEEQTYKGGGFRITTRPELPVLEITKWPYNQRVSLNLCIGSECHPVAFFTTDERATEFYNWLEEAFRALGGLP